MWMYTHAVHIVCTLHHLRHQPNDKFNAAPTCSGSFLDFSIGPAELVVADSSCCFPMIMNAANLAFPVLALLRCVTFICLFGFFEVSIVLKHLSGKLGGLDCT